MKKAFPLLEAMSSGYSIDDIPALERKLEVIKHRKQHYRQELVKAGTTAVYRNHSTSIMTAGSSFAFVAPEATPETQLWFKKLYDTLDVSSLPNNVALWLTRVADYMADPSAYTTVPVRHPTRRTVRSLGILFHYSEIMYLGTVPAGTVHLGGDAMVLPKMAKFVHAWLTKSIPASMDREDIEDVTQEVEEAERTRDRYDEANTAEIKLGNILQKLKAEALLQTKKQAVQLKPSVGPSQAAPPKMFVIGGNVSTNPYHTCDNAYAGSVQGCNFKDPQIKHAVEMFAKACANAGDPVAMVYHGIHKRTGLDAFAVCPDSMDFSNPDAAKLTTGPMLYCNGNTGTKVMVIHHSTRYEHLDKFIDPSDDAKTIANIEQLV